MVVFDVGHELVDTFRQLLKMVSTYKCLPECDA
jgi:hypothetical protein